MFVKGHTLAVIGRVSPGDLKHSIAFTVNNIIIYIKVAKKLDLKVLTTKKGMTIMGHDGNQSDLLKC